MKNKALMVIGVALLLAVCVLTGGKDANGDAEKPAETECVVGDLVLRKLPQKNESGPAQYFVELVDKSKTTWTLGAGVNDNRQVVLVELYKK